MQDSEFHEKIDQLLFNIEDSLDNDTGEYDLEYEIHSGILTLTFHDKSKIIINRQEPLHQLWMATKFNGHHFSFNEQQDSWICIRTGANFFEVLNDALSRQSNQKLTIKLSNN